MNIFGKRGQLCWDLHFLVKVDATGSVEALSADSSEAEVLDAMAENAVEATAADMVEVMTVVQLQH
jgi:hypothetical protein